MKTVFQKELYAKARYFEFVDAYTPKNTIFSPNPMHYVRKLKKVGKGPYVMKCLGFQIFTKGTASQERQEAETEATDSS